MVIIMAGKRRGSGEATANPLKSLKAGKRRGSGEATANPLKSLAGKRRRSNTPLQGGKPRPPEAAGFPPQGGGARAKPEGVIL